MGQKVNPYSFRIGVNTEWKSRWFAMREEYTKFLIEDWQIRDHIMKDKDLSHAAISRVDVERTGDQISVYVITARPGVVIGKNGQQADKIRAGLIKITGNQKVQLNISEPDKPELEASLIAQGIADQLESRVAFRRAMKRAVRNTLKAGAKGIRVQCSGRLGGSEMARTEWYREGRVPLHTLRAEIDYGFRVATTTYGLIGVKVWVYKGDNVLDRADTPESLQAAAAAQSEEPVDASGFGPVVSSKGREKAQTDTEGDDGEEGEGGPASEVSEASKSDEAGSQSEAPPPLTAADEAFEKLLEQEEEIERVAKDQHETPNFRHRDAD